VSTTDELWIGQNGKTNGPYTEALVRQWQTEGRLAPDAVAWREGMPDWVPLSGLFSGAASRPRQPLPPPDFVPTERVQATASSASRSYQNTDHSANDRAVLPDPPSLHWAVVLIVTIFTLGIFSLVWPFIQATWVRQIDNRSKANWLLALAFMALIPGQMLFFTAMRSTGAAAENHVPGEIGMLLLLAYWVLYLVAYFSMASSVRRKLAAYGLPVKIGGITLFFFSMYCLQCQLRWIARWKTTGLTLPKASKASIWVTFIVVVVMPIFLAVVIPAYQNYLVRTQVAEGIALADGASTAFDQYYASHQAAPADNAAAGLAASTAMTSQYVSGVDVSGGKITVAFDTPNANWSIRSKVLVLTPTLGVGQLSWSCNAESTVPEKDLPTACRH